MLVKEPCLLVLQVSSIDHQVAQLLAYTKIQISRLCWYNTLYDSCMTLFDSFCFV